MKMLTIFLNGSVDETCVERIPTRTHALSAVRTVILVLSMHGTMLWHPIWQMVIDSSCMPVLERVFLEEEDRLSEEDFRPLVEWDDKLRHRGVVLAITFGGVFVEILSYSCDPGSYE